MSSQSKTKYAHLMIIGINKWKIRIWSDINF